jgi:hypothetical protein
VKLSVMALLTCTGRTRTPASRFSRMLSASARFAVSAEIQVSTISQGSLVARVMQVPGKISLGALPGVVCGSRPPRELGELAHSLEGLFDLHAIASRGLPA